MNPYEMISNETKVFKGFFNKHNNPWAETLADDSDFKGECSASKPGRVLYSSTIDYCFNALIARMAIE